MTEEFNASPNFAFPVLTAEGRARCMSDDTPIARAAIDKQHSADAVAMLTKWNSEPNNHKISDLVTIGGSFLPLRKAMRENYLAVRSGEAEPKEQFAIALEVASANPDFARAVLKLGGKEVEAEKSHVVAALASGRSEGQSL